MISPKDISEKRFERAARGYRVEEVDTFLKEVAFSVAKIIKSYEESEAKIHKLVEKVNEYRDDEDSIKIAILGAQKQGKQITLDAELEAEKIISDAKEKAENIIEETKNQHTEELLKLENLRKEVTAFKAQLTELYNRQLHLIMEIPEFDEDVDDNDENNTFDLSDTEEYGNIDNVNTIEGEIDIEPQAKDPLSEGIEEFSTYGTVDPDKFFSMQDDELKNFAKFGDLRFGNNQIK